MKRQLLSAILALIALFSLSACNSSETAYQDGYTAGYQAAYSAGYDEGESSGYDDGYDSGYDEGYSDGKSSMASYSSGSSNSSITSNSSSIDEHSYTVYITKTGDKYHMDGCSYLKSRIPISLADAKANGYTPCSRCNPPS